LIADMKHIITLENVSYAYYDIIPALSGIDLRIREGEMLAVIGSNGSGKSTLLQVMSALIFPKEGRLYYRGEEVTEKKLRERKYKRMFRSSVGYVFQNSEVQLFCPTVYDELAFGPLQLGMGEKDTAERVTDVLALLNIPHLAERPTHMLSGGEKKRVAIGSMLTLNPDLLLLDEPMSGLDPKTESFLTDLVFTLSESGKTIVIATHDLGLVDHLQPRVAVLSEDHRLEKTGDAPMILDDEELLIRVNLIHEHKHRHGARVHSHLHSHFLLHDHKR
jgi:cobalt/nickel transport system ATP-binding protein